MNTGVMVNLTYSLFKAFEIMMGMVKRTPYRPGKGGPKAADHGIAEYLPLRSLRRIRLSNDV